MTVSLSKNDPPYVYVPYLKGMKFIDLFSGIGAFHQALKEKGAECLFASEIDDKARDIYELNYGLRPHGDITKIEAGEIPDHDILCAGFPCQAFSVAGKRKGFKDATRGTLFLDIARIAEHHQPKFIFLENVQGLVSHDKGRTFEIIRETLEFIGYDFHYKIMDCSQFLSPQKRKRVFIVATRSDLRIFDFKFPEPIIEFSMPISTVLDPDCSIQGMTQEYIHERDSKDDRYKVERIGRFKNGTQGYRIYSPNGLGVTLSSGGGGAGACTGLYKIGGKIRPLSAKECQKIVQFPNDFKRHRHDKTAVRQFGNSIPVFVISMILNQIERALMNIADRAKNGNKVNYKLQEQLTAV